MTLLELLESKLAYAGPRDRTVTLKISIGTARMLAETERQRAQEHERLKRVVVRWISDNAVTGAYGPWSVGWSDDDRWAWEHVDKWKEQFGIEV